ncbi:MAG: NAD(P)-dependent glycerol-3-phosphate dehydrogenase [Hyphomonadaceae bacterium]|nr:NAD(P)-dependent glycerol-3-phosphate dehydrogenase [Hyphomonadaceae bacterium]
MSYQNIGIIGAGAWGTALAQTLTNSGRNITIWAHEPECAAAINSRHENTHYLAGHALNETISATSDFTDLSGSDAVLVATPAQNMRRTLRNFAPYAKDGLPVILCSKGIEISSLKFMSEVLADELPSSIPAVLSGPSFAVDVVKGLPTAVTLACADRDVGARLVQSLAAPHFRPYYTGDVLGAEIGGAVKNVLAIVCGVVAGRGLGRSAHAAIITRGFAEMTRLGKALGCRPETLIGMCGLGDLVLTCSSEISRNMSCGMALGRGESLESIMAARVSVTEGVETAPALRQLARQSCVDMPICSAMASVLDGSEDIDAVIKRLLSREHKPEQA